MDTEKMLQACPNLLLNDSMVTEKMLQACPNLLLNDSMVTEKTSPWSQRSRPNILISLRHR
jgi:hypothetical protein